MSSKSETARETQRLLQRAVDEAVRAEVDDEAYWDAVEQLRKLGPLVVWAPVKALADDSRAEVRSLVPDILRYFNPHLLREETVSLLEAMLLGERAPTVLRDLASAFSDLEHERAEELLPALLNHADGGVRLAALQGLLSVLGPKTVGHFVSASRDSDDDVRNWATFGLRLALGEREDSRGMYTKDVGDALLARLGDEHAETRAEAVLALATQRDARALPVLQQELRRMPEWDHYIEAAQLFGTRSLLPLLKALADRHPDDAASLEGAIAACAQERSE